MIGWLSALGSAARKFMALMAILVATLAAAPAFAQEGAESTWWDDAWPFRKELTVNGANVGLDSTQSLSRYPALLRLDTANFAFEDARPDGGDLRIIGGDDRTPLRYYIESFDAANGLALIWVDLPNLAAQEQKLYLYYGNEEVSSSGSGPEVYDPNFRFVLNYGDAQGAPVDQTAFAGSVSPLFTVTSGAVGAGAAFTADSPILQVAPSPALEIDAGQGFTLESWVQEAASQPRAALFERTGPTGSVILGLENGVPFVEAGALRAVATAPITAGEWTHLAAVSTGTELRILVNGVVAGSVAGATPALNGPSAIGGRLDGTERFVGALDETRFSATPRPPDTSRRACVRKAPARPCSPMARILSAKRTSTPTGASLSAQ